MRDRRWLVVLTLAACASAAQSASAAAPPTDGGAGVPPGPGIDGVRCLGLPGAPCGRARTLLRGRSFVVSGEGLGATTQVVFRGRPGRRDDVIAHPSRVANDTVAASVPSRAHTGRLTLVDRYGRRVSTATAIAVRGAPEVAPIDAAPGSRFVFDGRRRPGFEFEVRGPTTEVELVAAETQEVVRTWEVEANPGQTARVVWDGKLGRRSAASGAYSFRLSSIAAEAGQSTVAEAPSFSFADHLFPIRGRHNLGYTRTNGFGGGRGHQGQDMFARCGTPLAAARGGRVQYAGYQSAAGYYAVIDGAATGRDYVYMHMRKPALVATGERVFTGQQIGEVGETGRATGCHLHFELWSSPGWYEGGRAFDPLPALRLWERAG